jgi:hypothetical protein
MCTRDNQKSSKMSGPYFDGQMPSTCGHYYPDVLRLRDEKKDDGKYVRVIDCAYCGQYEIELDLRSLSPAIAQKLRKKGYDIGIRERDVARKRKRKKRQFLSKKRRGK